MKFFGGESKDIFAEMTYILSNGSYNLNTMTTVSWFEWRQHYGSELVDWFVQPVRVRELSFKEPKP